MRLFLMNASGDLEFYASLKDATLPKMSRKCFRTIISTPTVFSCIGFAQSILERVFFFS